MQHRPVQPATFSGGARGTFHLMDLVELKRLVDLRRACLDGTARTTREWAGITIPEAAAVVGVAPATISRWETGQRRPRGSPACRYAELLALFTSS